MEGERNLHTNFKCTEYKPLPLSEQVVCQLVVQTGLDELPRLPVCLLEDLEYICI